MQIGVGLDGRLGLSIEQTSELARQAAGFGYDSVWTPASSTGFDSFHTCVRWSAATAGAVPGGLTTGISVVPVPTWTAVSLASQAATVGDVTGGRFVLGIGPGGAHTEEFRRTFGLAAHPPVALMREYLTVLRTLLAGETLSFDGRAMQLHGLRLAIKPPPVPVHLAALGPKMLELAGEAAEGVMPNWCSVEQTAWCREHVAEGARRAGRDPAEVPLVLYIRVCVDDDEDAARRAFARAVLPYALAARGASKTLGYRAHFARMGFDAALNELEARSDAGTPETDLADAFPPDLLARVGYFGRAAGAAAAFRRLSEGLDVAIVRVVTTQPTVEAAAATIEACQPGLLAA